MPVPRFQTYVNSKSNFGNVIVKVIMAIGKAIYNFKNIIVQFVKTILYSNNNMITLIIEVVLILCSFITFYLLCFQ